MRTDVTDCCCAVYTGVPGSQGCTSVNDTHAFVDTSNCYYFYQCVGFSPYRMPCPTGLQFNAATGKCDYSYNANCDFGGVPPATLPNPTGRLFTKLEYVAVNYLLPITPIFYYYILVINLNNRINVLCRICLPTWPNRCLLS
jgi:hypothetical protein